MTLIKSISGIRGTIGGSIGSNLTPLDVVKFTAAYGAFLKRTHKNKLVVIVGRDARVSGLMINHLVCGTLQGLGIDIIDLGLSTTPTVEMAVVGEKAQGGIILTASHNPGQWNALKLLNNKGEFISEKDGATLLKIAEEEDFKFVDVKKLGSYIGDNTWIDKHVKKILELPLVDVEAIKAADFSVVLDAVNSTGNIAIPKLLHALGVNKIISLYPELTGKFPHNPEPLPEHLSAICNEMKKGTHNIGIVVDPDVDRLALICEDGEPFGEEYTLVAAADYVLSQAVGNTVSNLSSSKALMDITNKKGGTYTASAVGEVNVVKVMKKTNAVIGGEGNGGIIYPELHYGRDAMVGIALILSHMAKSKKSLCRLKSSYPSYHISKNKIELTPNIDIDVILKAIKTKYKNYPVIDIDGVKIMFDDEWVHLRKSNTEPIIRIYSESQTVATAENLARKIMHDISEIIS